MRQRRAAPPDLHDPQQAAKAAHLRHVTDTGPGYTRHRHKDGFLYRDTKGADITDDAELTRIRKLAIPPAYTDVWICPHPTGHLQASGRDARGRKQYRYHAQWRTVRDEAKYSKMLVFGQKLPAIRAQVARDLALPGLPRRKVVAALVRLLEKTLIRIGNEEYASQNNSFGLTTLRNRHVKIAGTHLLFDFRGKHGVKHHIDLHDRKLAKIVERMHHIPGQDLFQYIDDNGTHHGIGSDDVNDYLHEIAGDDVTAKDFRTWAGTNLAALALREFQAVDSDAKRKKNLVQAVESVAKLLGNTPAVCRKCYIHPEIFHGYLDGSLAEGLQQRADAALDDPKAAGLTAEELAVTAYLARRLQHA